MWSLRQTGPTEARLPSRDLIRATRRDFIPKARHTGDRTIPFACAIRSELGDESGIDPTSMPRAREDVVPRAI